MNLLSDDMGESEAEDSYTPTQRMLMQWQWAFAFGPFVLMIALAQLGKADWIPIKVFVGLVCVAVGWAVAFKGYLLYLTYQK